MTADPVNQLENGDMPIYTYRCTNCENVFDHQQSFSDLPPTRCPQCQAGELHRVYKPIRVVFKGSGFYATDNRSPSGRVNGQAPKSQESGKTSEPASEPTGSKAVASTSADSTT